jgi:hypothetical protein
MSILIRYFLSAVLAGFSIAGAHPTYIQFKSENGLVVQYPASWNRLAGTRDQLDILSGPHRVEGAVIPHGEAEIIVNEIPLNARVPLAHFVVTNYGVRVVRKFRLSVPRRVGGCGTLESVDSEFEIAPDPKGIQIQTFYLCRIGRRSILTSLTRWKSDPPNASWERTALKVASNVRLSRPLKRVRAR